MKRRAFWAAIGLFGLVGLSGCQNENLFGGLHKEGSGDARSLIADGNAALADLNFPAAEDYFNRALAQDPRSAEALYGAAVAAMGRSGLNLGQLLSNLMTSNPGSSATALRSAVMTAAPGAPTDSILFGLSVADLHNALKAAIPLLERIRLGLSDGTIPADNPNLLINLGLCRILHAATWAYRRPVFDIRVSGSDFEVVQTGGACPDVAIAAEEAAWGARYLGLAAIKLNQSAGDMLFDLQNDAADLYDTQILAGTGCTPAPPSYFDVVLPTLPDQIPAD
ncbi:MAG: hypothetical protein IPN65_02110 [Elusimicrobia bacterium]|jgi:hypothetical protein|nr:hypothetical protein [Elusimicrobiota bacterium]MBK7544681.1 hypothetical protein [Elusimicrobiota bacterium]MBK7574214.1 hypothetical protein [Elusimicrobiota bacterium]MBK7688846.1 hypothetical protein [Elusimicrobiota bacterium]MBK8126343.1 hypothetical protein [Elusimicrobiota bacterium]